MGCLMSVTKKFKLSLCIKKIKNKKTIPENDEINRNV
jgi:hypothetical protein